jgi:curved DNA-binding protein CbpA
MFTDYYEILEISPNANSETIERIFRCLALRYHPNNQESGDLSRFNEIVEAHNKPPGCAVAFLKAAIAYDASLGD